MYHSSSASSFSHSLSRLHHHHWNALWNIWWFIYILSSSERSFLIHEAEGKEDWTRRRRRIKEEDREKRRKAVTHLDRHTLLVRTCNGSECLIEKGGKRKRGKNKMIDCIHCTFDAWFFVYHIYVCICITLTPLTLSLFYEDFIYLGVEREE